MASSNGVQSTYSRLDLIKLLFDMTAREHLTMFIFLWRGSYTELVTAIIITSSINRIDFHTKLEGKNTNTLRDNF